MNENVFICWFVPASYFNSNVKRDLHPELIALNTSYLLMTLQHPSYLFLISKVDLEALLYNSFINHKWNSFYLLLSSLYEFEFLHSINSIVALLVVLFTFHSQVRFDLQGAFRVCFTSSHLIVLTAICLRRRTSILSQSRYSITAKVAKKVESGISPWLAWTCCVADEECRRDLS